MSHPRIWFRGRNLGELGTEDSRSGDPENKISSFPAKYPYCSEGAASNPRNLSLEYIHPLCITDDFYGF